MNFFSIITVSLSMFAILSSRGVIAESNISQNSISKSETLPTVPYVDLEKYMGKWYEIALLPQRFEKNCTGTTADYALQANGKVRVINSCHLYTLDGELKVAKGTAIVKDETTNAKLKVTFFWPFYGDYWILDLGPNYEYAMIGAPNRNYLWFLSRTPTLSPEILERLTQKATQLGFDVSKLEMILQTK